MSEITVAIPSFNAMKYLPYVLERLQHQKIPNLQVLIWDNGSNDGTWGYLSNVCATNYFIKKSQEKNALNIAFFSHQQDLKKHPYVNAMIARKGLSKIVKTKYVFMLDPDVLIKPLSLPRLKQELEDSEADYVGMKYEPDALDLHKGQKHIMLGATLWKTEKFNSIPDFRNEDLKFGCDCNHCFRYAKGVHGKMQAEHLKNVFI